MLVGDDALLAQLELAVEQRGGKALTPHFLLQKQCRFEPQLAYELLHAAETIEGEIEGVEAVPLEWNEAVEVSREKIREAIGAIIANGAMLGGHVTVEDKVFISGTCMVHQFVRIGTLALMQGGRHSTPPRRMSSTSFRA